MPLRLRILRGCRGFARTRPARARAVLTAPAPPRDGAAATPWSVLVRRVSPGRVTLRQRRLCLHAQRGLCLACNGALGTRFHVDHIVPKWAGGGSVQANLQALHSPCHAMKTKAERPNLALSRRVVKCVIAALAASARTPPPPPLQTVTHTTPAMPRTAELISSEPQLGRPPTKQQQQLASLLSPRVLRGVAVIFAKAALVSDKTL